jgi:hypothetical protein
MPLSNCDLAFMTIALLHVGLREGRGVQRLLHTGAIRSSINLLMSGILL